MLVITRYNLGLKESKKQILDNASLAVNKGEISVIVGKNGAGKSSFAMSLLGLPEFERSGSVKVDNQETIGLEIHEIARLGIFVSFQSPPEFEGITLGQLILMGYKNFNKDNISSFKLKKQMIELISKLGLSKDFINRELNVGFSGGERRKSEILQMLIFKPKVVVLDEVDSGLDVHSLNKIAKMIKLFAIENQSCVIVISHNPIFIKKLEPRNIWELTDKQFIKTHVDSLFLD